MSTTQERVNDATDQGDVTIEVRSRVMLIGLDRSSKRNALTPKIMRELSEAYAAFDQDDELRRLSSSQQPSAQNGRKHMGANNDVSGRFRVEENALGNVEVPADHLWGAQTQRRVQLTAGRRKPASPYSRS